MKYTIKKLADTAGVSVRTLQYYDGFGLLKPGYRNAAGYRFYGEEALITLQQIMFFREMGFSLVEIKNIMHAPDYNVLEALRSHRVLLQKKAQRIAKLVATVDKTIKKFREETVMDIREYYQGFSDAQIEEYRREVKQRWGKKTLMESEEKVMSMGKEKFSALQAEGEAIFQSIADNIGKGAESPEVQAMVARWRVWLENFHHYSDEAVLGLGQMYSQDERFAAFYRKFHPEMPRFFTRAIEYYCARKKESDS